MQDRRIFSYVQQQTDRLSQMIDGKRGSLVDAIGGKTTQLTSEIDRVTSDALKSIEVRERRSSKSASTNGTDVARTITSAGELATGAVNKSLKDLEQASLVGAFDQSRQVSIAAVTEMQETSKILCCDTVALFERLREGNILCRKCSPARTTLLFAPTGRPPARPISRPPSATSAHATALRPSAGRSAHDLQRQDLEGAGRSRLAFQPVRWSPASRWSTLRRWSSKATALPPLPSPNASRCWNRRSPRSTCESSISISVCRGFIGPLDESPAAAEERARDIARVVAETAGAGSAAISRQFELVRAAAEESARADGRRHERNLPAEYPGNRRDVQAVCRQVRRDGGEHEADGDRNASRTGRHAQRTSPRRALRCRRKPPSNSGADAQGDTRRPDRGAGRTEPHRRTSRPWARRGPSFFSQREEEPAMAAAGRGGAVARPRMRDGGNSASNLPPPDLGAPASRRSSTRRRSVLRVPHRGA